MCQKVKITNYHPGQLYLRLVSSTILMIGNTLLSAANTLCVVKVINIAHASGPCPLVMRGWKHEWLPKVM